MHAELQRALALLEQSERPFYEACKLIRELVSRPQPKEVKPCATLTAPNAAQDLANTTDQVAVASPALRQSYPDGKGVDPGGYIAHERELVAPGHNPDRLTIAQVGEGWRLLEDDELWTSDEDAPLTCQAWIGERAWSAGPATYVGAAPTITYRTHLTRAELRDARGMEPEPPFRGTSIGGNAAQDAVQTARERQRDRDAEDRAWANEEVGKYLSAEGPVDVVDLLLAAIARERAQARAVTDEEAVRKLEIHLNKIYQLLPAPGTSPILSGGATCELVSPAHLDEALGLVAQCQEILAGFHASRRSES